MGYNCGKIMGKPYRQEYCCPANSADGYTAALQTGILLPCRQCRRVYRFPADNTDRCLQERVPALSCSCKHFLCVSFKAGHLVLALLTSSSSTTSFLPRSLSSPFPPPSSYLPPSPPPPSIPPTTKTPDCNSIYTVAYTCHISGFKLG